MAFDKGLILANARAGNFTRQQSTSFIICTRASYYIYVLPRIASTATSSSWYRLCRGLRTSFHLLSLTKQAYMWARTRVLSGGSFCCSPLCFQKRVSDAPIGFNDCTRFRLRRSCNNCEGSPGSTTKGRQHQSLGNLLEWLHLHRDPSAWSDFRQNVTPAWPQRYWLLPADKWALLLKAARKKCRAWQY